LHSLSISWDHFEQEQCDSITVARCFTASVMEVQ
jgi:hypothetical protein